MPHIELIHGEKKEVVEVKDGTSLFDFMVERYPEEKNFPVPTIALFEGQPVLRDQWKSTRLFDKAVAIFSSLPMGGGGGGSNPIATILQVVVMIVGAIVSIWCPPAGALIMMAGNILIGLLFKNKPVSAGHIDPVNNEAASPTYSLNASGNRARLGQPLGELFGKMQVLCDVVAQPYSIYRNNDMYLYQVFGIGRGENVVHQLSFGDTVFWKDGRLIPSAYVFDDTPTDSIIDTALPFEEWSTAHLVAPLSEVARNITLVFSFPNGLCSYSFTDAKWVDKYDPDSGQPTQVWERGYFSVAGNTFRCEVEIREVDNLGAPMEDWRAFTTVAHTAASTSATSYSLRCPALDEYGNFELRVKNTSTPIGTITVQETGKPDSMGRPTAPIARSIDARETASWQRVSSVGSSVQVQILPSGNPVTLFPDNVETSVAVANHELCAPNTQNYAEIGPFPCCPPGTRTDKILLDITFPRGLYTIDDRGAVVSVGVSYRFEYRHIDDNGESSGDWAVLFSGSKSLATQTPQRYTIECVVPEGRYEIKGRRTSNTSGGTRTVDALHWESMRSILPGTLKYNQSVIAIRTRSNNTLSQNASEQFKAVMTRKLPVYDPETKTWSEPIPTRSFAAAAAWVCMSPWGGKLPASVIDLDGLWAIDKMITEKGWSVDAWVDGAYLVADLMVEVCKIVQVIARPTGNKLTFLFDGPDRPVKHVFTPYNIVRGSLIPWWATHDGSTPDDVIVSYIDEDAGYAQRDVRAVLPDSESLEPAQQQPIGSVKRGQSHAFGVHMSACNRYRRVGFEFKTEGIGRLLSVGDIVAIKHPRTRSLLSGKLTDWNSAQLILEADVSILDDAGANYMSLTRPDGSVWGPVLLDWVDNSLIKINSNDYANLILQGFGSPFDWLTKGFDRQPTIWTLHTSHEIDDRFIIQKIGPVDDPYHYNITVVNDDPRVYNQNIPVPPWEYRGNTQEIKEPDTPESLFGKFSDNQGTTVLFLSWLRVDGAQWYDVELSYDGATWERVGRVNINAASVEVEAGRVYARVRAINAIGESLWAAWTGDSTVDVPSSPVPVLRSSYIGGNLEIEWAPVENATNYVVRLFLEDTTTPLFRISTTAPQFLQSIANSAEYGGPWRSFIITVSAENEAGESAAGALEIYDPSPPEIGNISGTISATSVTLTSLDVGGGDITGFVLLRGRIDNFLMEEVVEMRVTDILPYEWGGLVPETEYYFRVAAKDAFFDGATDYASLNYSATLIVTTGSA